MAKVLEGSHISKLDDKDRVTVRPEHRDVLGREVVLTPGLDPCIVLFPSLIWERYRAALLGAEIMDPDAEDLRRHIVGGVHVAQIDQRYGRVHLPDHLLHWAEIDPTQWRDVLVVGCLDRLEFWHPDTYRDYMRERVPRLKETLRRLLVAARGEGPAT